MLKKLYLLIGTALVVSVGIAFSPPSNFWPHQLIVVKEGMSVAEIATSLDNQGIIRSSKLFEWLVRLKPGEATIIAGNYFFPQRTGVLGVAGRVVRGDFGLTPIRFTLQEGLMATEMSKVLEQKLPNFNSEVFLKLADKEEGYLFPDTYFILPGTTEAEIIERMLENYEMKTKPLWAEFAASPYTEEQVIVMASLLEEEARTLESKKVIAGILWKRLEDGMMLQVDAVFPYLIGKNTFEVTKKDLTYDSPYNTYKYGGLPPGPITNPGLESIQAALEPTESPYWYYLSDWSGNLHYSATFDEHKAFRIKYNI